MSPETSVLPVVFPILHRLGQDRLEAQGQARGHIAGFAAGMKVAQVEVDAQMARLEAEQAEFGRLAEERLAATVASLTEAVRSLTERTIPVLTDIQDVIAASAIELAEAIIGRELADKENSARSALTRALRHVDAATVNVVRMNPVDLALLGTSLRDAAGVRFVADSNLAHGDAITEFTDGFLDARIGSALARAKSALLGIPGQS
jgi:flagellar assembly protein FliH